MMNSKLILTLLSIAALTGCSQLGLMASCEGVEGSRIANLPQDEELAACVKACRLERVMCEGDKIRDLECFKKVEATAGILYKEYMDAKSKELTESSPHVSQKIHSLKTFTDFASEEAAACQALERTRLTGCEEAEKSCSEKCPTLLKTHEGFWPQGLKAKYSVLLTEK